MTTTSAEIATSLTTSRYAMLGSHRADGTIVNTPIWFAIDGNALVFRTKRGPKTRRLLANPRVVLQPCDYRGRLTGDVVIHGSAQLLDGEAAEIANRALHRRYGWQWNIMPMVKVPGVVNVHRELPLRVKLRRTRTRSVWPDSAIVSVVIEPTAGPPTRA